MRLVIKISFFGVTLYLLAVYSGYIKIEYSYLVKCIFGAFTYMYWFLTAYIVLTLICPYLNRFLDAVSEKELKNILIILFPVVYILPIVIGYFDLTGRLGCAIYIYLFVGYLERKKGDQNHFFKKYAVQGFLITSLAVILYEAGVSILGTYYYPPIQRYIEVLEGTQSPVLFVDSMFAFYIFKNMKLKSSRLINFLGAHSPGVFLIHGPGKLSRLILWDTILKGNVYYHCSSRKFLGHYIICTVGLFTLGIITHFLYTVLIENFIVNHFLSKRYGG